MKTTWRVLVDGIHLSPQAKGVGLYTQNVLEHLLAMDDMLQLDVVVLENEQTVDLEDRGPSGGGPLGELERLHWLPVPWKNHLWHGFSCIPKWVKERRPDVVWMPYETPIARLPVPFQVVCHDIPSALRQAQELGGTPMPLWRRWQHRVDDWLLGKTLRRAEVIFSNSRWVGEGLAQGFGLDTQRLQLAPCAPAVDFEALSRDVDRSAVRRRLGLDDGFVLTFHTGDPRENHRVVPSAFDRLLDCESSVGLVIAGLRPGQQERVEALYRDVPWRHRVRFMPFLGASQRFELAELYAAASVYLDPSLQEGFGMQVIEAMACGTPVVCSNRSALPEVAGDAALLVDPQDATAIASTLKTLLDDPQLQAQFEERGRQRARTFQWQHTAKVIYDALHLSAKGKTHSGDDSP